MNLNLKDRYTGYLTPADAIRCIVRCINHGHAEGIES